MFWQLALIQILFFLCLLLALQKLFHGNLIKAMNRLEALRQGNLKKEDDIKQLQQKTAMECTQKIRAAEEEAAVIRKKADEEIKNMRQLAAAQLEEEMSSMRLEFEQREKTAEARYKQQAKLEAGFIACDLVRNSFTKKMRLLLHQQLCQDLIEAVADHIIDTIFLQDANVSHVEVKIVKLALSERGEEIGITLGRGRK